MKGALGFILFWFAHNLFASDPIHLIKLIDTINPGSADFVIQRINEANEAKAPFLIIQLDTPGGLLTSTRQIIQSILNSKTPIVVWVGPQGAQAGSAGALITFAADVAVMATGSNIGAAHPVQSSGQSLDATMNDKITNDTAAFAEGVAKAKGRNFQWARQSVTESKSVTAQEALKLNVIDFIADDISSLQKQLHQYKLKQPKGPIDHIESANLKILEQGPSLKHRTVSFFANPSLAYLILTLGGLCIWVELSHPGLILPGVIGGFCVLLSLISFQLLPIRMGALGLILFGLIMLVAEIYVTSYGALGLGGLVAFVLGSIFLMDTTTPEFQISLSLIFPVATCLALSLFAISYIVLKTKRIKLSDHYLGLIGSVGQTHVEITPTSGTIFLQGELWKARTKDGTKIPAGKSVKIIEVKGLVLTVQEGDKAL